MADFSMWLNSKKQNPRHINKLTFCKKAQVNQKSKQQSCLRFFSYHCYLTTTVSSFPEIALPGVTSVEPRPTANILSTKAHCLFQTNLLFWIGQSVLGLDTYLETQKCWLNYSTGATFNSTMNNGSTVEERGRIFAATSSEIAFWFCNITWKLVNVPDHCLGSTESTPKSSTAGLQLSPAEPGKGTVLSCLQPLSGIKKNVWRIPKHTHFISAMS